jgi:hypothetical protein
MGIVGTLGVELQREEGESAGSGLRRRHRERARDRQKKTHEVRKVSVIFARDGDCNSSRLVSSITYHIFLSFSPLRKTRTMTDTPRPLKRQRKATDGPHEIPQPPPTHHLPPQPQQPVDHIFIADGLLNKKPGGKKVNISCLLSLNSVLILRSRPHSPAANVVGERRISCAS